MKVLGFSAKGGILQRIRVKGVPGGQKRTSWDRRSVEDINDTPDLTAEFEAGHSGGWG